MSFGLSVPAVGVTFELIDKNVSHYLPFVRTCCRSRFQSSLTRTCLTIFHYRHPLSDLLSTLTDEENMSHEIPIHRRHPLMRYEKKQVSDELPFVGARCRSCFRSSLMRRCLMNIPFVGACCRSRFQSSLITKNTHPHTHADISFA